MQTIFQIIVTVAALVVIVYAVQQHSPTTDKSNQATDKCYPFGQLASDRSGCRWCLDQSPQQRYSPTNHFHCGSQVEGEPTSRH